LAIGPFCMVVDGASVMPIIMDWYCSGVRVGSSDARWVIRKGRLLGWGG